EVGQITARTFVIVEFAFPRLDRVKARFGGDANLVFETGGADGGGVEADRPGAAAVLMRARGGACASVRLRLSAGAARDCGEGEAGGRTDGEEVAAFDRALGGLRHWCGSCGTGAYLI